MHSCLKFIFGIKLYMCRTVPLSINRSWKTTDDGQRNCPKHVEHYSKKNEKLIHLVGFIIRIFHDARSPGRQFQKNIWPIWQAIVEKMYVTFSWAC